MPMRNRLKHIIDEQIEYYSARQVSFTNELREKLLYITVMCFAVFMIVFSTVIPAASEENDYEATGGGMWFKVDENAVRNAEKIAETYLPDNEQRDEYITTEVIEGSGYTLSTPALLILDDLYQDFMNFLLNNFRTLEPEEPIEINQGGSSTNIGDIFDTLLDTFSIIGAVIATFLFLFSLFVTMFKGKLDERSADHPVRIVFKYAVSLFLIKFARTIIEWFWDVVHAAWGAVYDSITLNTNHLVPSLNDLVMLTVNNSGMPQFHKTGTFTIPAILEVIANKIPEFKSFVFIVSLIILWPILKAFLELAIEIIERYLVLMIIYSLFPLGMSFIPNTDTSGIVKQYFTMLASQIVVMASNFVFIAGSLLLFKNGVHKASLLGYIFVLSFLRTGQRFDTYLNNLGLNVAQTGGRILEAMQGAILGMNSVIRSVGNARRAGGVALSYAGAMTGSKALFKAGTLAGMSARSIREAQNSGMGGLFSDQRMYSIMGNNPNSTLSAPDSHAESMIVQNVTNHTAVNQKALSTIKSENVSNIVNKHLGTNMTTNSISLTNANRGVVKFQNQLSNGDAIRMAIGPEGKNLKNNDGQYIGSHGQNANAEIFDNKGVGTGAYISSENQWRSGKLDRLSGLSNNNEYLLTMGITNFAQYPINGEIAEARYNKATKNVQMYDASGNTIAMYNNRTGEVINAQESAPTIRETISEKDVEVINEVFKERYGYDLDLEKGVLSQDGSSIILNDEINDQNIAVNIRDAGATSQDTYRGEVALTDEDNHTKSVVSFEEFNTQGAKDIVAGDIDCLNLSEYMQNSIEKRYNGTIDWDNITPVPDTDNTAFSFTDGDKEVIIELRDVGSSGKGPNINNKEKSIYDKSTAQQIAVKIRRFIKEKA